MEENWGNGTDQLRGTCLTAWPHITAPSNLRNNSERILRLVSEECVTVSGNKGSLIPTRANQLSASVHPGWILFAWMDQNLWYFLEIQFRKSEKSGSEYEKWENKGSLTLLGANQLLGLVHPGHWGAVSCTIPLETSPPMECIVYSHA